MTLINFGIDFGNGYVKAKSGKGSFVIPSAIVVDDLKDNEISSIYEEENNVHSFKRKSDDNAYLFGADIINKSHANSLIWTNSNNDRYNIESFKRLAEFALCELASYEESDSIDVRLVTGMPSEELGFSRIKSNFEDFLKGIHAVERDGKSYAINVKEVKIIEQPLGTLFDTYLNEESMIHKDFKHGNIVVIDFGSGTTIIDEYQQMKRAKGITIREGMKSFFKNIAQKLSSQVEVSVNPIFIERGIKDGSFVAEFGQNKFPFKDIFEREVKIKLENTISAYEENIVESTVNAFVLTGGGANIFSNYLNELKKNFIVVDEPQTSTSYGYYKLAAALGK